MKLSEVVGPEDASDFYDRDATEMFWSAENNEFQENAITHSNITTPYGTPIDSDDILPFLYHRGIYYPLFSQNVRAAKTIAPDAGSYPVEGDTPNVYPIKFVQVTYTETPGNQTEVVTDLSASPGPEGFVLNLWEGDGSYIPVDTVIWIFRQGVQWFTFIAPSTVADENVAGYDGGAQQLRGHDSSGTPTWYDVSPC